MNKYLLIPIVIILGGALVSGWILMRGGDTNVSKATGNPQRDLRKVDLAIKNMTCPGCRASVINSLKGMSGVVRADADAKSGLGWVVYAPSQTNTDKIANASIFQAYPASIQQTADVPADVEQSLNKLASGWKNGKTTITDSSQRDLSRAIKHNAWEKAQAILTN